MTPSRGSLARWTLGVVGLWAATALIAVAAPVMVTGSDPTRIRSPWSSHHPWLPS